MGLSTEEPVYAYRIVHADAEGMIRNIIECEEMITPKGNIRFFVVDILKEVLRDEGTLTFTKKKEA